jgi:phage terminase small subunit
MNEKQKAFADYYITNGCNGTQAAIQAGYSEKTAGQIASRLLKDVKIQEYIKERLASKESERVANQNEVLEFWTSVMRGQVQDQLGLETPVKERNKAGEYLARVHGLLKDDKVNLKADVVQIVDDIK